MEFALQLDDEFSTLGRDLSLLPYLILPRFSCLLVDVFVFLRLVHHLPQLVSQCLPGVISLTRRLREFLHYLGDLLRYVEYARLHLSNLEYDLLVVVSESVHLLCILRLDVCEGFVFILCYVAISRIIVCLVLSRHRLEPSNLHGEYVLSPERMVRLLRASILRVWVARLDAVVVGEQVSDGISMVVSVAHDADL